MKLLSFLSAIALSCDSSINRRLSSQHCLAALFSIAVLSGCGSSSSQSVESIAPVIYLNGSADIMHNYHEEYIDAGAFALDDIDADVTVIASGIDEIDVDVLNAIYVINYTATDSDGNEAIPVTRTVSIKHMGPVITFEGGSATVELGQGRVYREVAATAYDYFDEESKAVTVVASNLILSEEGTADQLGSYEVTYSAENDAGQVTETILTINVVERRPFITTWDTRNEGASDELSIIISGDDDLNPYYDTHEYSSLAEKYYYEIDCGEDATVEGWQTVSTEQFSEYANFTCTYDVAGIKTIKINDIIEDGKFAQLQAVTGGDAKKLLSVEQWGDVKLLSMEDAFYLASNLVVNASDTPDLRLVTTIRYAFAYTEQMSYSLANWDVSDIQDMSNVFANTPLFDEDISGWDVSAVTDFSYMFDDAASFNQDISTWNVSAVEDMSSMFEGASLFDQNLGPWQVQSVLSMEDMFVGASLSTTNLDAMLNAWSEQEVNYDVELWWGNSVRSSASDDAVETLEATYGWQFY